METRNLKIKVIFLTIFVILIIVVANGIAQEFNTDDIKPVTLRLGHTEAVISIRESAAQLFATKVNEYSNGKIKIETFPAGQLGTIPSMTELCMTDSLDFTCTTPGLLEPYDPNKKTGVTQLPFLFDSYEQSWAFMDSDFVKELFEPIQSVGIRFISMWENGFRHITNNKRPIYTPKDLKGLKIRVVKSSVSEAIIKSMGANPVPMAFTELYTALQSGVVDGQENPFSVIYPSRFDEVQKYLSLTGHQYDSLPLIMSKSSWERLGPVGQQIIQKAADEARDFYRYSVFSTEAKWKKELEDKGMKINEPDIPSFREAVKQAYIELEPKYGADLINNVIAKAKEIRELYPLK